MSVQAILVVTVRRLGSKVKIPLDDEIFKQRWLH